MKNFKVMFLAVLMLAAGFHLTQASGQQNDLKRGDRKGLPAEMIISADELHKLQISKKKIVLLDARSEKSYNELHIRGAVLSLTPEYYQRLNLFKSGVVSERPDADAALKAAMEKYPKDRPVVTYCNSGGCQASAVLALQIKRLGFNDVRAMEDGIQNWDSKGYPVVGEKK